ncbi:histidine phosphatase family protein [Phytoactinopolyspora mesophila]|uniref:histidine phosphatase family protein n=1 Tax=Phytoactinopolyspora mesophila TaxID=2650750 RepID=UPI00139104B9
MSGRWAVDEPQFETWREAQLILIRHGESHWNAEGRVQGQLGTGLTPLGHTQAAAVSRHLHATYPKPALVFSSDLERVMQTSAPYLSRTGYPVELDKRLREIDCGAWSGLLREDVLERFPEEIAAIQAGEDVRRGGGENFAAMRARVGEALRDIAELTVRGIPPENTATALVFTHGGPVRVATAEALDLPPDGHRLLEPPDNCSVTILNMTVDPDGEVTAIRLGGYNSVFFSSVDATTHSADAVGERQP